MVMDLFLRKLYVDLTDDEYNASRPREDDVEGPMYSDETILRALRALEQTEEGTPERNYMVQMMRKHGPRVGATVGGDYESSYEGGQDKFDNLLADFREARKERDLLGQVAASGKAAYGVLNPLGGASNVGMMDGILRYFIEKQRGE
jgi:hypothetical protein